ncbi:MAG: hypothetical protein DRK00_06105, partial [Thermoprotei archaeon]
MAMVKALNSLLVRVEALTVVMMLILLSLTAIDNVCAQGQDSEEDLTRILSELDFNAVKQHVKHLSSLGSRMTGYLGSYRAASYIAETLRSYGLEVELHNYSIAMPIEEECYIEALEPDRIRVKAHMLWPNGVSLGLTPVDGLVGRLIYAGDGELEEIRGKPLGGSIVLLEFNSGLNWIELVNLGARAVVFIEPRDTTHIESLKKTVPVSLPIPRVYVNATVGGILKRLAEREATVRLTLRASWRQVEGVNVIGKLKGREMPSEVIVISAHYDSWSVVPAVSPGTEESLGVASLLELARVFSLHRPLRTIWFVAFSGYWQAVAGATEWVEAYAFKEEVLNGSLKLWIQLDLDLSTDSDAIEALYTTPPGFYAGTAEFASAFTPFSLIMQ